MSRKHNFNRLRTIANSNNRKKLRGNQKTFPIYFLLPNLITLSSLCLGLSSIRYAFHGNFIVATSLIIGAAILDGIDGRIARLLKATSDFGAQLDSLADFANFGIAPGFVLYFWMNSFYDIKGLDWALVMFFAVCCAIRLARFNADLQNNNNPVLDKYFFKGIPSPVGALLSLLPIFLHFEFGEGFYDEASNIATYSSAIAILMASRIPTISIKKINIRSEFLSITFILLCALIIGLIIEPWLTLISIGFVYLATIPVSIFFFFKIELNTKALKVKSNN